MKSHLRGSDRDWLKGFSKCSKYSCELQERKALGMFSIDVLYPHNEEFFSSAGYNSLHCEFAVRNTGKESIN